MRSIIFSFAFIALVSCQNEPATESDNTGEIAINDSLRSEVDSFITSYTGQLQDLYYTSAKAAWELNTRIVEGDTTSAYKAQLADEAYAAFTGSEENIQKSQEYLDQKVALTDI